jgi:hypothetical protein
VILGPPSSAFGASRSCPPKSVETIRAREAAETLTRPVHRSRFSSVSACG